MTEPDPWSDHADSEPPDSGDALIDAVRRDLQRRRSPGDGVLGRAPHVVCWSSLSVDQVEAELNALSDWVEWLVSRYCLDHRVVPPCWHLHGALVEELSALHSLWQACFGDEASPPDPAMFHQHLALAIQRLRDWASRRDCKPDHHRDDQPPVWPPRRQRDGL